VRVRRVGVVTRTAMAHDGRVSFSGYLSKRGHVITAWKNRFFVIDARCEGKNLICRALYYINATETRPQGTIELAGADVFIPANEDAGLGDTWFPFAIRAASGKVFPLRVTSVEDREEWVRHFAQAIKLGASAARTDRYSIQVVHKDGAIPESSTGSYVAGILGEGLRCITDARNARISMTEEALRAEVLAQRSERERQAREKREEDLLVSSSTVGSARSGQTAASSESSRSGGHGRAPQGRSGRAGYGSGRGAHRRQRPQDHIVGDADRERRAAADAAAKPAPPPSMPSPRRAAVGAQKSQKPSPSLRPDSSAAPPAPPGGKKKQPANPLQQQHSHPAAGGWRAAGGRGGGGGAERDGADGGANGGAPRRKGGGGGGGEGVGTSLNEASASLIAEAAEAVEAWVATWGGDRLLEALLVDLGPVLGSSGLRPAELGKVDPASPSTVKKAYVFIPLATKHHWLSLPAATRTTSTTFSHPPTTKKYISTETR